MKYISLCLSLCFTLNVMAATGTVSELERTFDDYQYTMTVDWDQKDQAFYAKESSAFFNKMGALINEQGLTKDEVLAFAEKKMANKEAFEALKLKLTMVKNVKSSEALASVLSESSKDFYAKGASWNGDVVLTSALIAGVVLIVAYALWFDNTHKCVAYDSRWECDSYDYDYNYSTTSCGWVDYCTQYEKK